MIDFSNFFYNVYGLCKITFIPNTIKRFPENVFWKMNFLCIPNTRKRFPTILKISTKHWKMNQFFRKCFLENELFSKKGFTSKQTEFKCYINEGLIGCINPHFKICIII